MKKLNCMLCDIEMRTLVTPTLYAKSASLMANFKPEAVPDPDLEMGGGGGGQRSSRPLDKGGEGVVSQNFFSALRASV